MKANMHEYYGVITTDNTGNIIELDNYAKTLMNIEDKYIGKNIVKFFPEYSIESFYVENQNSNIQLIPSNRIVAFSSYNITEKTVYIKIVIFAMDALIKAFNRISSDEISVDTMYLMSQIFADTNREEGVIEIEKNGIVGTSPEMKNLFNIIGKIANTDANLLLTGETGVGKSMFAKIIHEASDRKNAPFVEINCATIHNNLIESELFGYEEGSFTGANNKGKVGNIELSGGGTLFLDEITELPLDMQQKLLQAIQDKRFTRVGGNEYIEIDFRLISATNRDLETLVKEGAFREDLYYRINVIPMNIPPIRNREEDIIALTLHFTRLNNEKYDKTKSFSKDALQVFCKYSWPGNVRELENLVERMILTSTNEVIGRDELPIYLQNIVINDRKSSSTLKDALDDYERRIIIDAYSKYKTSVAVGEELGISQTGAARKIRKYVKQNEDWNEK